MKRISLPIVFATIVALFGFGCASTSPKALTEEKVSGYQLVDPSEKSIEQVTKELRMMTPATIHAIATYGDTVPARERGYGSKVDITMVVNEFSPNLSASFDWTIDSTISGKPRQITGTLRDIHLAENADVYLPITWVQGDRSADNTAGIWISSHVYENISKSHQSTLYFGMTNVDQIAGLMKLYPITAERMQQVKRLADTVRGSDPTLATREEKLVEIPITVNGKETKVQAYRLKSWFGIMDVLANEQNPLILNVTPSSDIPQKDVAQLLDYHVTSISDLNQPL